MPKNDRETVTEKNKENLEPCRRTKKSRTSEPVRRPGKTSSGIEDKGVNENSTCTPHRKIKKKSSKYKAPPIVNNTGASQKNVQKSFDVQLKELSEKLRPSWHAVRLSRNELQALYVKYKKDGHYRINLDQPFAQSLSDSSESKDLANNQNVQSTYNYPVCETALENHLPFFESSNSNTANNHTHSLVENNRNFNTNNPSDFSSYNDFRTSDFNGTYCNLYPATQENFGHPFNGHYLADCNSANVSTSLANFNETCNSQNFWQLYEHQEIRSPSNRTNHCDFSNNVSPNNLPAQNALQHNASYNAQYGSKDTSTNFNVLRSAYISESDASLISSSFHADNASSGNVRSNDFLTINDNNNNNFFDTLCDINTGSWETEESSSLYFKTGLEQNESLFADVNAAYRLPEMRDFTYE